jgi:hypothetical protein
MKENMVKKYSMHGENKKKYIKMLAGRPRGESTGEI